jgi:excisionase family DNA binding protein
MSIATAPPAPPQVRPVEPPEPTLFSPAPPVAKPVSAPAPVAEKVIERSRPPRLDNKPVQPPASLDHPGTQEMWDRLPKHVQLLVGMHPTEIAQRSYKKFRESREDLVQRLLDPTISLEETARILNVCPTTVRRYTNRDALKHLRTAGNQRRFRLSDVLAFMESLATKKVVASD